MLNINIRPWLLEVNLSPSLTCDTPLDTHIKSSLIADAFNLIGVRKFEKRKENIGKIKQRMKSFMRAKSFHRTAYSKNGSVQKTTDNNTDPLQVSIDFDQKKREEEDFLSKNKYFVDKISVRTLNLLSLTAYISKSTSSTAMLCVILYRRRRGGRTSCASTHRSRRTSTTSTFLRRGSCTKLCIASSSRTNISRSARLRHQALPPTRVVRRMICHPRSQQVAGSS